MSGKSQTTVGGFILRRSTIVNWYSEIWGRRTYFEKVGSNYWHVRVGSKYLASPIVNVTRTFSSLEKAVAAAERVILEKRDLERARDAAKDARRLHKLGKSRKARKRRIKTKRRQVRKAQVQVAREQERKVRKIRAKGVMRRIGTEWDF